jgi:nitroreductase
MPKEIYEKLIEAARQAPSSYNLQHTRLVHVKEQKIKEAISKAAYNQPQILSSCVFFVRKYKIISLNLFPLFIKLDLI